MRLVADHTGERGQTKRGDESSLDNALTPFMRVICLELQASCFVRVGNDQAALRAYNAAMALLDEEQSSYDSVSRPCVQKGQVVAEALALQGSRDAVSTRCR
jgi:hypothetical protein